MVATLVRTVKGKSLFSVSQNPAGLFSANRNDIARDSSGTLYTCLGGTLWEATGSDDVEKGAVISKIGSGGGGGGSGGGTMLVTDAGTTSLTAADSGKTISAFASSVVFELPETAEDGIFFRFIGGPVAFSVNGTGGAIIPVFGGDFQMSAGRAVELMAFNIAGQLYWISTQLENHATWNATVSYAIGDTVTYSGKVYICKTTHNGNQNPASDNGSYWELVSAPFIDEDYFDLAGKVTISGTAAPTPNFEVLHATQVDKLAIMEIACRYSSPGTDNTAIEIDLTDFIADIPYPYMWANLFKEFGRIMVNNQVFADAVFNYADYKVTVTIPATNISHFLIRFVYRTQ